MRKLLIIVVLLYSAPMPAHVPAWTGFTPKNYKKEEYIANVCPQFLSYKNTSADLTKIDATSCSCYSCGNVLCKTLKEVVEHCGW